MKVSIAMATHNGARFLRQQLDSFAAQTVLPFELCIGDDASTDGTADIVEEFSQKAPFPVHFRRNKERLGYGQNFIATAQRCSGDWIAFSDQDDVWLPAKLKTCMSAVIRAHDPELLLVTHRAAVVDESLQPMGQSLPADYRGGVRSPLSHELTWSYYGFAMLFRADLLEVFVKGPRIPTVFTDIDRYPHDVWISTLANVMGKTLHLPHELCLYRRHDLTATLTAKENGQEPFLAAARATGAAYYAHAAATCRESAQCLLHYAPEIGPDAWRERLLAGVAAYARLAEAFEMRASIYHAPALGPRMKAISSLLFGEGYFGLGASAFGTRALLKDATACVAPRLFRSFSEAPA